VDDANNVTITTADVYDVVCTADGATTQTPDVLEVVPGLPAVLSVAARPTRDLYAVGEVVTLETFVADEYGNVIRDATIEFESDPSVPSFGNGRYRLDAEGIIVLGATVPLPTATGVPLFDSVQVVVNGEGPEIGCVSPFDGDMLTLEPGTVIDFEASVQDTFSVANVLINGEPAALTGEGTFLGQVTTRRGINFVNVSGQDAFGEENSTLCAFMVSDRYIAPGASQNDTVSLRLTQEAFDDNNRADNIDSLNDIVYAILNNEVSPGVLALENLINTAIAPGSELFNQCFADTFLGCALRARLTYNGNDVLSPNNTSLTLVDGGLRLRATLRRIQLNLTVVVTAVGLNAVNTRGNVTVDNATFDTILNLRTGSDGRPDITVRGGTTSIGIGNIATNFSGIDGAIINAIVGLANALLRGVVEDAISGIFEDTINGALDGIFSTLGSDVLATALDIPRLDGSGNVSIGFGLGFSTTAADPNRAIFGLASRVTGPALRAPGAGSLRNPDPMLLDSGSRAISAGIQFSFLNQVLYGLWRGEFFDANIGAFIGGAGLGDADGTLAVALPPTVLGRPGGGIAIHLGAAQLRLAIPGLIDDPLALKIGAVATANVVIVDETNIEFRDLALSEFYFSTIDASLPADTRAVLENFLRRLVQSLLDDALNSALPSLPVPSFALPEALVAFGLPRGASLGLLSPVLELTGTHFVVQGNFGIQ
jgi:hypothetical protein